MSDYRYLLDLVPPEELPGLLELFWDAANGTANAPALHVYKRYPVYVEMENELRRRLTAAMPSLTTPGKVPTDGGVVRIRPTLAGVDPWAARGDWPKSK